MWYIEAHKEKNIPYDENYIIAAYAIYPQRFYKNIDNTLNKVLDFCFIGTFKIDDETILNRKWIIPFIETYFNNNSYLQFTDKNTKKNYISMGDFDYTLKKTGFVPKEKSIENRNFFDVDYFSTMCKSKFCLCPAGDRIFSMRFYEALMCRAIPIVDNIEETYRSDEESKLDYKFYLTSDKEFIYIEDWAEHNYNLFLKYHTLEFA